MPRAMNAERRYSRRVLEKGLKVDPLSVPDIVPKRRRMPKKAAPANDATALAATDSGSDNSEDSVSPSVDDVSQPTSQPTSQPLKAVAEEEPQGPVVHMTGFPPRSLQQDGEVDFGPISRIKSGFSHVCRVSAPRCQPGGDGRSPCDKDEEEASALASPEPTPAHVTPPSTPVCAAKATPVSRVSAERGTPHSARRLYKENTAVDSDGASESDGKTADDETSEDEH